MDYSPGKVHSPAGFILDVSTAEIASNVKTSWASQLVAMRYHLSRLCLSMTPLRPCRLDPHAFVDESSLRLALHYAQTEQVHLECLQCSKAWPDSVKCNGPQCWTHSFPTCTVLSPYTVLIACHSVPDPYKWSRPNPKLPRITVERHVWPAQICSSDLDNIEPGS